MIKTETITINNKEFVRTYSTLGFMIERDGVKYSEAVDIPSLNRTYTETDEPIEKSEEAATAELQAKAQAYDIITGVTE